MYNLWSAKQKVIVKLYIKLGILIFLFFKIKQLFSWLQKWCTIMSKTSEKDLGKN